MRRLVVKVKKNSRVRLYYQMTTSEGQEIDSTEEGSPFEFVCGRGDVVPGFERELMGMEPGMKKTFTVSPEDAYGQRSEDLVKKLPRASFPGDVKLTKGQRFSYRSEQGTELIQVCDVTDETITADFNHPLAGKAVHYDVEILDIVEEISEPKK